MKGEYVLKKNKKYILLCIVFVFVLFPMNSFAKVKTKPNLIWFGDSRTVGLGIAVYSYVPTGMPYAIIQKHIVAKSGADYNWAKKEGYKELKKRLKKHPRSNVIINFGINDLRIGKDRSSGYIKLIKKIKKRFPKTKIYYMSINPVACNPNYFYIPTQKRANTLNHQIQLYNKKMKKKLPKYCKYINTNQKLHFSYDDGLHYTHNTYLKISKYITGKKKLKK